ncbi:MAG: aminotransferase class IV [Phycisphaerales bacterium]
MIVHLNGRLIPREQATVSAFDRGFIFGDGVYEGLRSFRGRVVGMERHLRRMRDGLREARIEFDPETLTPATAALLESNSLPDAFIYWQVTRGTPGPGQPVRSRLPAGPITPTVFGYCSPQPPFERFTAPPTITCTVVQDTRWRRGHLKSISLLGNILAALEGQEAGSQDAIMVRDGLVSEASATNVIIALPLPGEPGHPRPGPCELVTPSLDGVSILGGITRELLVDFVPDLQVRDIREEELFRASEVMLVGTTSMVTAVTHLSGRAIGDGTPGPMARRLLNDLLGIINDDLRLGIALPLPARGEPPPVAAVPGLAPA